ncbi:trihydroxytoluene oxygenase [Exophiala viscosa]|uniref:Trihydroxytoluene oxygenase n=1 Tax=Exophiala viscosa TaxID=2486360 RepID=A0AAN6I8Z0_9EURO|nr:trihydroxytoluene oxygenase [Exophiala viscosa]
MNDPEQLKHNITEEKLKTQKPSNGNISRGPSPNRGSSLRDVEAIGPDSESKREWQKKRGIDRSKQVRIVKLNHTRYQHPDLAVITTFLRDFGMHVTKKSDNERWFRGYGPDQYVYYAKQGPKKYLGAAFQVESREELEKLLNLPGSTVLTDGIEEMKDAPGGGYIVTIADPEGFPVSFVYGQAEVKEERKKPAKLLINDEVDKPRQKAFQRFEPGPAEVHKLGHFGLNVQDFPAQMDWYTRHFNLLPSDILYVPLEKIDPETGKPARKEVALFAMIDRGQDLTDHHTFFMTTLSDGVEKHVHHSSFEVHDFDTQLLGHHWLAEKKYESVWGVGRHILGSQIFDYWWDVNGFMVEHYADGDLVNEDTPVGYGPAANEGLAVWGPEVPGAFLE